MTLDRRKSLKVFGAGLFAATAPVSGRLFAQPGPRRSYFADNGFGAGVAIVQHPAGEYLDGKTYVSYQGPREDPYVAVYDHTTGAWDGPYQAGVSQLGKGPGFADKIDNHGKPTLLIDDAGYIHIFYGGHGGSKNNGLKNSLGGAHVGDNLHAISKRPYDISEWEDLDNISPFGTYNQAIKMDNGDIYLFYRHGAHRSNWVYQKSTDNGRNFAEPVSFMERQRRPDIAATDSWYPYLTRGNGTDIIISFDYHVCRDRFPQEFSHRGERHNLYYMVFDTASKTLRNVKGEALPMPIDRAAADAKARVFESEEMWTMNQSSSLDDEGYPHIGIAMGRNVGDRNGGPKAMRHFRWNGQEWVGGHDAGLPVSRGDIHAVSQEEVRFLLASREKVGRRRYGTIAWWESEDGGATFQKGEVLLELPRGGVKTSAFIHNAHPDARVIVAGRTPRGSKLRPMYLVGDSGPIGRVLQG